MGIKKAHTYKDKTKEERSSPSGTSIYFLKSFTLPWSARYKQARDNMTDTSNVNNTHNGYEFVDLGLPSGLLWATCNVGATSPEQAGLYFAWGETTGYTAAQVTGRVRRFERASYKAKGIKTDLTLKQDAAHVNLGGKWRMPTVIEIDELIDNCTVTWTDDYNGTGVAGRLFTSNINGNTVFFPAAGDCFNSSVGNQNSYGFYWSASWLDSVSAWCMYFSYRRIYTYGDSRYNGRSVRGVCER